MLELLDFWAEWCGPCHAMKPIIEDLEKVYSGKVKFSKVEVDNNQELAAKYGVMHIPTYILVKDGVELDRKSGAMPKDRLASWIDSVSSR